MHINRLFEIVYLLLNKKTITAKELAKHFEVSVRTIYRDIDTLSAARIPIYTSKGKGGGISLMDDFVLNKSMLSEQEQDEILMSLQSLNAMKLPDIEPLLSKLSVLFNKQGKNWIDIDFSHWSNDNREKFNMLKTAILSANIVSFDYFGSAGEKTARIVEPLKLVLKDKAGISIAFAEPKMTLGYLKSIALKIWYTPRNPFTERFLTLCGIFLRKPVEIEWSR